MNKLIGLIALIAFLFSSMTTQTVCACESAHNHIEEQHQEVMDKTDLCPHHAEAMEQEAEPSSTSDAHPDEHHCVSHCGTCSHGLLGLALPKFDSNPESIVSQHNTFTHQLYEDPQLTHLLRPSISNA